MRTYGDEVAGGGDVSHGLVTSALDLVTQAELEVLIIKLMVTKAQFSRTEKENFVIICTEAAAFNT